MASAPAFRGGFEAAAAVDDGALDFAVFLAVETLGPWAGGELIG